MPYLGLFGLTFKETIVIFEISTLEFVRYEFLTHTVNFGIGSTFSKGPGPLYKVYRKKVMRYKGLSIDLTQNE